MLTSNSRAHNKLDLIFRRRDELNNSAYKMVMFALLVPPLFFYLGLTKSYAGGLLIVTAYISLAKIRCLPEKQISALYISNGRRRSVIAVIILMIATHLLLSDAITGKVDFIRGVLSLILLTIVLSAAAKFSNALACSSSEGFNNGMKKFFILMCIFAGYGVINHIFQLGNVPTLAAEPWRKPIFIFSEPAAFASAFIPIAMYMCVTTHGLTRFIVIIIGLATSLAIQNLTLAFGVILVALITLRIPILATLFIFIAAFFQVVDMTYFMERVDISGKGQNLSNLVYFQGWQMIGEAMNRSNFIGLGFQQLGISGTEVPASEVIRSMRGGEDSNLLDGGFVFAKFGADFGVFSILVALIYSYIAIASIQTLRSAALHKKKLHSALILAHASVLTFVVEMFVRGVGYFSGTALLFITSLWLIRRANASSPR